LSSLSEEKTQGFTINELRRRLRDELRDGGIERAELESRLISRKALGVDETYLLSYPEEGVSQRVAALAEGLLARRLDNEPMAYIMGEKEFFSRPFLVNPSVLIPRPETELLVEEALGILKNPDYPPRVFDVGAGSGCVGITIALEHPRAVVAATDISPEALEVARRNAERLGVPEVGFLKGDLLNPVSDGTIDLLVSNPPYVSEEEYQGLPREIREHEPRAALMGGAEGLDVIGRIVCDAPRVLVDGGWCVMEIGATQGNAVRALFGAAGFSRIEVIKDHSGLDRIVKGRWKSW